MLSKLVHADQLSWSPLSGETLSWQHKVLVMTGAVLGGTGVLWYLWRRYQERGLPPGPKRPWFWVRAPEFPLEDLLIEAQAEYGDVVTVHNGEELVIGLNSYSAVKEAYMDRGDDFSERGLNYCYQIGMASKDDIWSPPYTGSEYNATRKMLVGCFRSAGKGNMEEKVLGQVELLLNNLEPVAAQKQPVNFKEIIPKLLASVIIHVLMNKVYDFNGPQVEKFLKLVKGIASSFYTIIPLPSLLAPHLGPILYRNRTQKIWKHMEAMRGYIQAEVKQHIATYDGNNPRDFIDLYWAKTKGEHDLIRMTDNVIIFIHDAVETLGIQLQWVLLYIAYHQDVQQRVAEEIYSVTSGNRLVKWADKPSLPYTEATIAEVLRTNPAFPTSTPRISKKDTTFRGYRIPAGMEIYPNIKAIHYDPDVFPNPDEFKPDRFLDEDGKFVQWPSWIPFSMSRRKCPGEPLVRVELFLFLSNLVQSYKMTFPEGEEPSLKQDVLYIARLPASYRVLLSRRT